MLSTPQTLLPFETARPKPKTVRARSTTRDDNWQRPSLNEFIDRLESSYGMSDRRRKVAVAMGLASSDELSPSGLREFCDQLGVPPEDFGLDPWAEE